jgi:hypothetical protein
VSAALSDRLSLADKMLGLFGAALESPGVFAAEPAEEPSAVPGANFLAVNFLSPSTLFKLLGIIVIASTPLQILLLEHVAGLRGSKDNTGYLRRTQGV